MKRRLSGFSLVELLVVISIIGILSSVFFVNFNEGSEQSRDAQRKSDLRNLQNAIELYKNKNGRYPEGCNGPGVWSGLASDYACTAGDQYIKELAPEFISALPVDPKSNGDDSGYVYTVNAERTVYKIMAKKTVENEILNNRNLDFESCDVTDSSYGVCDKSYVNSNNAQPWCTVSNVQFQTSYALWGGYPEENWSCPDPRCQEKQENIICDIQ